MVCEPDLITIREAICIMAHCNQIRLIHNTNKLLFKIEISAMVSLFMPQPFKWISIFRILRLCSYRSLMRDMYGHSDVRSTLPQCIHSAILRAFQPKPALFILSTSESEIDIGHLWPEDRRQGSCNVPTPQRKYPIKTPLDTEPTNDTEYTTKTPVHSGDFKMLHVVSLMCAEIYDVPRWTLYGM